MTIDLVRGTTRQWVVGEDGVKRWVDNNEPVNMDEPCPPAVVTLPPAINGIPSITYGPWVELCRRD